MLSEAFLWATRKSPSARRYMWSAFYQSVAHRFSALDWWHFMNYGCADLAGDRAPIALRNEDEDERYCIQLYDHVASAVDLRNRDVLEVGCGRGGGASYIARYLHPKSMVGVDIAGSAIQFCRRAHRSEGLRFLKGDAENLPFADQSFDVVINIESSFCYGDMARFLSEVGRVLRPGGSFLLADLRLAHEVEGLLADLRASPLEILETKDITAEVGHALAFDHERRVKGMNGKIPFLLRGVVNTFAGVQGTRIPNLLSSGELVYLNVVLRKSPGREEEAQPPDDACRSLPWEGRKVPAAFAQGEARSATARSSFFF